MVFYLPVAAVIVLALVGAATAGVRAGAVDLSTGRRVELSVLAAVLVIVAVLVALFAYGVWRFATSFTF